MPMFITYASYSTSATKGLIDEPSDRSAVTKAMVESGGGKYVAMYFTTGSYDVVLGTEDATVRTRWPLAWRVSGHGLGAKSESES